MQEKFRTVAHNRHGQTTSENPFNSIEESANDKLIEFMFSDNFKYFIQALNEEEANQENNSPIQKPGLWLGGEKDKGGTLVFAHKDSAIQGLFTIFKTLKVHIQDSKTRNKETEKAINIKIDKFKSKIFRKLGNLMHQGEDWPITLIASLLFSDSQILEKLSHLNMDTRNGYLRVSELMNADIQNAKDFFNTIKRRISFPGISEDMIDTSFALLMQTMVKK